MDFQNTSKTDVNLPSGALVVDVDPSNIPNDAVSHARNCIMEQGSKPYRGNEPSIKKCYSAPYNWVGHIDLPDNKQLVFSSDETNSEIGIGDSKLCTYTKILNDPCLNFSKKYPITGKSKKNFQGKVIATFTDKHNPVRRIELNNLSEIKSCDDILLWKKISHPCIEISKGTVGSVPNGSYSAAIAYVVDNNVFSDYLSITNRLQLFSKEGMNAIDIEISGLDSDFDEFQLVIVGNYIDPVTKGATKLAKTIGTYSTKVNKISVTDFINSNYKEVKLSSLISVKETWQKAGIIESNSNILILADLVSRKESDYQLKAMSIKARYVVQQVPYNYYEKDGREIGYYRDENYQYFIQGVYNTGELTDKYVIGFRKPNDNDLSPISSSDVYEYDKQFNDCEDPGRIPRWKVENTAGNMIPYNNEFVCDKRMLGYGELGYFESTELYPDNEKTFGEDANTPIRIPKMPDELKVQRYQVINGKVYINIIGIQFYDIPKFDDEDIVGYKITRSERRGGNGTVQARGIMTNLRYYDDEKKKQTIMYSNYTVNDLSADKFLSSTQTVFKNNKETNFHPLTGVYDDKFSFYSPHTLFEPRYSLGTEVKIEAEEVGDVRGNFELVYKHPKAKLMNQFSFWIAAAVGFIESSLIIIGKRTEKGGKDAKISAEGVSSGTSDTWRFDRDFPINSVEDLIGLDLPAYIQAKILARDFSVSTITSILTAIASLGIKIPYSILSGIKWAEQTFDTIFNFTGYTDYTYQYNAYCNFNRSIPITRGNKRRRLLFPATYIPPTKVTVNDRIFSNYGRERCVYLELNKSISKPSVKDNTRNTISGFKMCSAPTDSISSTASAYYATIKNPNPNQYGQLGSASSVSIHSCVLTFADEDLSESPVLFGGDCIIERLQIMKKMPFFSQDLANTNYPDGVEYDYRKYPNIGYPRYWIDTTKYDFSELLSSNVINYARFSRTTSSKHNLDCKGGDKKSISRIDDAYMYLSNNCVIDFFVEADYNVSFREETTTPHYSKSNSNISELFRSDKLSNDEEFKINFNVFSDTYTTEIYAQQQRYDFDPSDPIPVNQPNSVIYSLPSFNLQEIDNWQYFLPANFFAFSETDFGILKSIHKLDQDRLGFFFSGSSPYVSMGRSLLELNGQTVTIGDGGLFSQDPREVMPTDENYGSCTSKYAFTSNRFGKFYPSADKGMIINFSSSLIDITEQGISSWCKMYMPIRLYDYFPDYKEEENPIAGVGYLAAFDSDYKIVYMTKRDFSPKYTDITYNATTKKFQYKGNEVSIRDSRYFNDISWTLSYSPAFNIFVGWHDWHPDWIVQGDKHFMSVKGKTLWKHNERYDSFCNYYDEDKPFEIEVISSSGQTIHTVRSIEYVLEAYHYKNFGRNRFNLFNKNFDGLVVRNIEQISPYLNMQYGTEDPETNLLFPRKNTSTPVTYDVLYFREENKYRVNQFWDAVKDRGEFSNAEVHLFPTDESGYKSIVNPVAVNMDKLEEERKKFRHYVNHFRFYRAVSGSDKLILKVVNVKKLISQK